MSAKDLIRGGQSETSQIITDLSTLSTLCQSLATQLSLTTLQNNLGNFQGQTNLKTLKDALGIPDTALKSLYTCLVTDRLDNAGYGLSVIRAAILQAYEEIEVIEHHVHKKSRLFGKSPDQSGNDWCTENSLTPFRAISGNNAFGSDLNDEAKVFGTADTPFITGHTFFDPGLIQVIAASVDTVFAIRLVWGTGTLSDAIAAGNYSTISSRFDSTNPQLTAFLNLAIGSEMLPVGTKVWVQVKNATDNATLDFLVDAHGYAI